jgi:hypothetical protein
VVARVNEKKALMLFQLRANKGNVADAVKKTGISRMTHYRWLREDADYAQGVEDIGESVVDFMESLLLKTTIEEKDLRTMRWFLERKGRNRGYGKPSVAQAFDSEGNPVYSGGGDNVGVQNNINLSIRADVPGDALTKAIQDLASKNPALISKLLGTAENAEVKHSAGYVEKPVLDAEFVSMDELEDMDEDELDDMFDGEDA